MDLRKTFILSVWVLVLCCICFGLGYPTLNRYYPPSSHGLRDSTQYYAIVENGPSAASGHWKYRVLVPYLAKPIYWAARNRLGTWNPTSFALLLVNSAFCAASALLVSILAFLISANCGIAVTAAFAYLLNFTVSNYHLSGMVDSADAFWFVLLTWTLLTRRWWALPLIGLGAGLSKETFLPVAFVFATVWVFTEPSDERPKKFFAIVTMIALGMATVLTVHSIVDHAIATPWSMLTQEKTLSPPADFNVLGMLISWNVWLTLGWSLFLFLTAGRFPKGWRYGVIAAVVMVVLLAAWDHAGWDNVARPLFNILGPLLAISFALAVEQVQHSAGWRRGDSHP